MSIVTTNPTTNKPTLETLPPEAFEAVTVSVSALSAACHIGRLISLRADGPRHIAIASSGSGSVLVQRALVGPDMPSWAKRGITIYADRVSRLLGFLRSGGCGHVDIEFDHARQSARLQYQKSLTLELQTESPRGDEPTAGVDYRPHMAQWSGVFAGNLDGFEGVSVPLQRAKLINEIAKRLGLSEHNSVSVYAAKADEQSEADGGLGVTFDGCQALLILQTQGTTTASVGLASEILAPAVKASVAALKAHQTRARNDLAKAKTDSARQKAQGRIDRYTEQIRAIQKPVREKAAEDRKIQALRDERRQRYAAQKAEATAKSLPAPTVTGTGNA